MEICKSNNQNTGSKNGSTNEKMVSILVVDDDRTCLSVVASLLKGCSYQVLTAKDPLDALCILRTGAIKFDLIVSDVHMPGVDGFELQRRIHQEFQIPVVLMSGDGEASNLCEGSQSGASFFVIKPITAEDLKSIWDFGNQWKKKLAKGKSMISDDSYDNDNEDDIGYNLYEKKSKRKLQITDNDDHNDGKNIAMDDGKNIATEGEALVTKKNKVIWTPSLHGKFVRAMQHLGPEGSVPRNIHTVMNVPALKREHVASHLQKFRNFQKKQSEAGHNPDMFKTLQNGNRWSSSNLRPKALVGSGESKLLTNPGFPPSGLMNGTNPSQMYQPQTPKFPSSDKNFNGLNSVQNLASIHMNHNGFSKQIQPPNYCYNGSGQEVYNTFVSQRNFASPQFDAVVPEQQYESADPSKTLLDGNTYQSTNENTNQDYYVGNNFDFGDAFLVNKDMPNADKVPLNVDENIYQDYYVGNNFDCGDADLVNKDMPNADKVPTNLDENENQDYYVGNNFDCGDAFLVNKDMPNAGKVPTNLDENENQDYYVGNNFDCGDAFLVNKDMPNADKVPTNLDENENQDYYVVNNFDCGDAFLVNKDMPNADKVPTNLDENENQDYYVGNNFDFGDAFLVNKDMPNADKVHTDLDENENQDYYVGNNFDFGDAFLVNNDMPNADKVHTDLDKQENSKEVKNGEVNRASSGSNYTTRVEELVFRDEKNPSEKHDNGGMANSAYNTGTSNFESKGNQPSDDDQQGMGDDIWAWLRSGFL